MLESCFPRPSTLYAEARSFATNRLAGASRQEGGRGESGGEFRREAWDLLAEFGLFRAPFPREAGGLGLASEEICDVLEGLGAGTSDNSLLFAAGAHLWAVLLPLFEFGTEAQKERWLEPLMSGRAIGAHAASEAAAGSDVMAMQTRCRESGDAFVLDGSKMWVTNAPQADLFMVFATSDPRLHFRGISAFLVERKTPGLEVAPAEDKMGLRGAPLATVFLDGCRVPKTALLGKVRQGSRIFQTSLTWERTLIQGSQVGAMRRQVERAVEHAKLRRQFGKAIGKYQAVSHRIVDMWVRYWKARLVLRMAARELEENGGTVYAALAKLVLAEASLHTHLDALKTFGASGYMCETGIERDVRDALGGSIYSGTSDIQHNILAEALGL